MGSYISTTTIYDDEMSRLTTTVMPASILTAYIAKAEAVANGFISQRYTLSDVITANPPIIQGIVRDLTIYYALKKLYTKDNQNGSEWLAALKEDAFELLNMIADNKIKLVASSTVLSSNLAASMRSSHENIPLIFNVDDEYEWHVSDNLLDDIADARDDAD